MSIFELAMSMESEGRTYYLKHAENTTHPALKRILLELADDELKHYNYFKALHEGQSAKLEETDLTSIFKTVKTVFEEAAQSSESHSIADDARKIWGQAMEVEKKSEMLYRQKADECDSAEEKALLIAVADEERRHWQVIHSVCDFLDFPDRYLADAEWGKIEEL